MTMDHVNLADVRPYRQRVFAHTESGWVWEIRAELAHKLEDARILSVAHNRESRLKGCVRDERS